MILVEADVDGEWDSHTDWRSLTEKAARAAIAHTRFAALADGHICVEVSAKFTTDDAVRELNAAYRKKDKPTNVLSFPMLDKEELTALAGVDAIEILLGDIVLAAGICAAEAAERGISIEAHATHLVAHGILHLLGYDHETGQRDAEEMEQIERRALASIGMADPYPAEPGLQDQPHG
jgi:probable rRNA maturation factor